MNRAFASLSVAAVAFCTAGEATSAPDVEIIPDVAYGHKAGMALTFDVIKPKGKATGSAVLVMVSGGWFSRWSPPDMALEEGSPYIPLVESGHMLFLVRHGSAPQFKVPEAVADVRRAVRFIRQHASDYGIDANRIGVFGSSAGGHLSLMLGTASDAGKADAKDPIERVSDRVAAVVVTFRRPISEPSLDQARDIPRWSLIQRWRRACRHCCMSPAMIRQAS